MVTPPCIFATTVGTQGVGWYSRVCPLCISWHLCASYGNRVSLFLMPQPILEWRWILCSFAEEFSFFCNPPVQDRNATSNTRLHLRRRDTSYWKVTRTQCLRDLFTKNRFEYYSNRWTSLSYTTTTGSHTLNTTERRLFSARFPSVYFRVYLWSPDID